MMEQLLKTKGGDSFVVRIGSGDPLLVLHGGLGLDHSGFRPYLDALSDQFEVVYVDLLGNGRSGHLPDAFETDHSMWVNQINAICDELGFEKIFLLGHSHGGVIAQRFALAHPDRLKGLILSATGPSFDHVETVMKNLVEISTPEQFEIYTTQIFIEQPDDETWAKRWRKVMPLYFATPPSEEFLDARHAKTVHRAEGFNACILHVPHFDVRDRLHEVLVPTLVIGGSKDFCFPEEVGPGLLAKLIPNAKLLMLKNSGHNPYSEEPDAFVEGVRSFASQI
jgi:proline iminopeptidase